MRLSSLKTDTEREANGVWTPFAGGIELLLARIGNPRYEAFLRRKGRPMRQQMRAGTISDEDLEVLSKEAIAHHVLLDWKNVEDDDGEPITYTPEKGIAVFSQREYRDLYRFVVEAAADRQRYSEQETEDLAGNCGEDSAGV